MPKKPQFVKNWGFFLVAPVFPKTRQEKIFCKYKKTYRVCMFYMYTHCVFQSIHFLNKMMKSLKKMGAMMYNYFMKLKEFEIEAARFGERLRHIRMQKGLSQGSLATLANTSQRMIAHYESHVKRPSIDKVKKFADALEVSVDELLGADDKIPNKKANEEIDFTLMRRLRVIKKLPVRDQKAIFRLISSLAYKIKINIE
jgi:transcriptional regulator with XRE-family HTH domain